MDNLVKYWLNADPEPENKEPEHKEPIKDESKEKPTFNEEEFFKRIMACIDQKIDTLKVPQPETKKEEKKKEEAPIDPRLQEVLDNVKAQTELFLMNKKEEFKNKYGVNDEDLSEISTLEELTKFEKIYAKSFSKAKEKYLSEETISKELAKRKKMITDIDDKPGEQAIKQKQEEMTKTIFNLIKSK